MSKAKRSFNYHWGSGEVAEEAQVSGEHHMPTIQLLKFTDGPAAGTIRCALVVPATDPVTEASPKAVASATFDKSSFKGRPVTVVPAGVPEVTVPTVKALDMLDAIQIWSKCRTRLELSFLMVRTSSAVLSVV